MEEIKDGGGDTAFKNRVTLLKTDSEWFWRVVLPRQLCEEELRELPDIMSASEGGHGKADIVREVA